MVMKKIGMLFIIAVVIFGVVKVVTPLPKINGDQIQDAAIVNRHIGSAPKIDGDKINFATSSITIGPLSLTPVNTVYPYVNFSTGTTYVGTMIGTVFGGNTYNVAPPSTTEACLYVGSTIGNAVIVGGPLHATNPEPVLLYNSDNLDIDGTQDLDLILATVGADRITIITVATNTAAIAVTVGGIGTVDKTVYSAFTHNGAGSNYTFAPLALASESVTLWGSDGANGTRSTTNDATFATDTMYIGSYSGVVWSDTSDTGRIQNGKVTVTGTATGTVSFTYPYGSAISAVTCSFYNSVSPEVVKPCGLSSEPATGSFSWTLYTASTGTVHWMAIGKD